MLQILALLLILTGVSVAHNGGTTVYAGPAPSVVVDGSVDDWPPGTPFLALRDKGAFHGRTDLDDVDLDDSADLNARFAVGYSDSALLVAVVVQDDVLRVGPGYKHTDACEIYLDVDHSGERVVFWPTQDPNELAALQYVAIPGDGSYGPQHAGNPSLFLAPLDTTRTRMAYAREGDLTIYEWSIPLHTRFPDRWIAPRAGTRIGFDVVVVDKDRPSDNPARVGWAPTGAYKYVNAQQLGDLQFVDQMGGTVTAHVRSSDQLSHPVVLALLGEDGHAHARALRQGGGSVALHAPAGAYRLTAVGVDRSDTVDVVVRAGTETEVTLAVSGAPAPAARSLFDSDWVFRAFVGALLSFTLLHLMLYLFYPALRENLFFSLFTLCTASLLYIHYQMEVGESDPDTIHLYEKLFSIVSIAVFLSGLRFLYQLYDRSLRRFWIFTIAGSAWIVVMWDSMFPGVFFGFVAIPEMLWTTVVAIRRRTSGAWIILSGFVLLTGAWLYQALMWINVLDPVIEYVYMYGFVGMLLPMSVFLARDVALTNHRLSEQLDEVKRLSELTIEQERKARHEEYERRLLEADNERKTRELEEARQMQIALLPSDPEVDEDFDIHFQMHTATEVGGDYYDYQQLDDGSLVLAVGDATGHGARSSLIMATTKGLFGSLAGLVEGDELLRRMARGIRDMNLRHQHMCLTLVHLHGRNMRVHSAGMPPVHVYRRRERVVEEVLLEAMPLGAGRSTEYPVWETELASGDVVLMMSDGLPEHLNPAGEPFGYERTQRTFAEAGEDSAADICEALTRAGVDWGAGLDQDDDITLVAIRVPPA